MPVVELRRLLVTAPSVLVSIRAKMDFIEKARIMDRPRASIARWPALLRRLWKKNHGAGDLYLVGIRRRGVPLAETKWLTKIADLEGDRPAGWHSRQ